MWRQAGQKPAQLAAKRWPRLQFPGFADRFRPLMARTAQSEAGL